MYNLGFYSSSPQQGKSTISKYLVEKYNYSMLTFASPMKDMITIIFKGLGYSDDKIEAMLYGNLKEVIVKELGVTPRHMLVTLGSEWGRGMIDDSMWIKIAMKSLDNTINHVCEDIRLLNEAERLRSKGFKIIRVINPRATLVESISEGKLDDYNFDKVLINDGTIEDLQKSVDSMIKEWEN
jgi:hypothetical protein